jgi:hypothetical protein
MMGVGHSLRLAKMMGVGCTYAQVSAKLGFAPVKYNHANQKFADTPA